VQLRGAGRRQPPEGPLLLLLLLSAAGWRQIGHGKMGPQRATQQAGQDTIAGVVI
jgi:hypothetical protein